jgi:alpha/beta superfamily hydrolase
MNSEDLPIPGGRDVHATLDGPDSESPESVVVACPPHPQHQGHRGDPRLKAVSADLCENGVACLRIDYGEWDEGYGEREDARNALRWARDRYDRVGIFGFSFGTCVAALAAGSVNQRPDAVSLLAPTDKLAADLDTVAALDDVAAPTQVVYGTRDDTVNWEPVVERARELGFEVVELGADHFFVGQHETVADRVAGFLVEHLG